MRPLLWVGGAATQYATSMQLLCIDLFSSHSLNVPRLYILTYIII